MKNKRISVPDNSRYSFEDATQLLVHRERVGLGMISPGTKVISDIKATSIFTDSGIVYIPSMKRRLFAFGDIHGDAHTLLGLLKETDFYRSRDIFVILGDLIDKGTKSAEVMSIVLDLLTQYPNRFFVIRGNHENLMTLAPGPYLDFHATNVENLYQGYRLEPYQQNFFRALPHMLVTANGLVLVHGGSSVSSRISLYNSKRPTEFQKDQQTGIQGEKFFQPGELGGDIIYTYFDPESQNRQELKYKSQSAPKGEDQIWVHGRNQAYRFLNQLGGNILVRGHQSEFKRFKQATIFNGLVTTLFSAGSGSPDYPDNDRDVWYGCYNLSGEIRPELAARYLTQYKQSP